MISVPRLYAVVDAAFFPATEDLAVFAEQLIDGGCSVLQYRNKSGNARMMLEQACELRRRSRARAPAPHIPKLIMNDRADLCLIAEFDGVHVGQDDLSPESVRRIIGPDAGLGFRRIIQSSCSKRIRLRRIILPSDLCFRLPAKTGLIRWWASKGCAGRGS